MNCKVKSIRQYMKRESLSGVLITDGYNIQALSGYRGHTGIMLITFEQLYIFTDSRYTEQLRLEAPQALCVDIKGDGYAKTIARTLAMDVEETTLRLGFEDENISYKQYHALRAAFAETSKQKVELVALQDTINRLRIVKDKDALFYLAQAEAIGDRAFAHITDSIRPGMTEREIAFLLEGFMYRQGAEKTSFDTIVASGPNSSLPHAIPTNRPLQEGDFVTMDFGCVYKGYCSDMTRTIYIGDKPTAKMQEVYTIVKKAQCEALSAVRPGKKCCEIDAIARNVIQEAGYGDYFGHGLGHGVGLYIHEEPRFSPKCDDVLVPGIVITVEPGIYLPGEFGVRIEDMIAITEDGYQNLTNSTKELLCIA